MIYDENLLVYFKKSQFIMNDLFDLLSESFPAVWKRKYLFDSFFPGEENQKIKIYINCRGYRNSYFMINTRLKMNVRHRYCLYLLKSNNINDQVIKEYDFNYSSLEDLFSYIVAFFNLKMSLDESNSKDLLKDTNLKAVKVKFDGNNIYAAPLLFIDDDISIDDVRTFLSNPRKHEDMLFKKDASYYSFSKDKYEHYKNDSGEYDCSIMSIKLLAQYVIDKHFDLFYIFEKEALNQGYKYKDLNSFKRHLFLHALKECDNKYSREFISYALNYYFKKKHDSYNQRVTRFLEKAYANIDKWNYFVTFTYNDELLNENEFKKKLKKWFQHSSERYGIYLMGSFERSQSGRLHFHCIMSLPINFINNLSIVEEEYYEKDKGRLRTSPISQSLKKKFGRCEFINIYKEEGEIDKILLYVCKYITKQRDSIYCSRNLPNYRYGTINNFYDHIIGKLSPDTNFFLMDNESKLVVS